MRRGQRETRGTRQRRVSWADPLWTEQRRCLSREVVVVNAEQERHGLSCKLNRTRVDKERLEHILLKNVGDLSLTDVDTRRPLAERMSVAQLGNNADGVQTGILSQRGGNDLESLGVRLEAVSLHALERLGELV